MGRKGWKNLKRNLKTITRKTTPASFDERIAKLKEFQRGWLQYFRMTSIQGKLKEVDSWMRNRLRYCIWHDCLKGIPVGEEARTETEEPDPPGHLIRASLCMEPDEDGRLGGCTKPDTEDNHYCEASDETGIRIIA